MSLAFYCSMLSGGRKFCAYHFICQLFMQSIVNVFTYCFDIPAKQLCHLTSCQPHGFILHAHIELYRVVFRTIDDDLTSIGVMYVYICHISVLLFSFLLLCTQFSCKVTTFFAYLQIFSKFYVNQKLAGSQKQNKKRHNLFGLCLLECEKGLSLRSGFVFVDKMCAKLHKNIHMFLIFSCRLSN